MRAFFSGAKHTLYTYGSHWCSFRTREECRPIKGSGENLDSSKAADVAIWGKKGL